MSGQEWKPGTVAMVNVAAKCDPCRALRGQDGWWLASDEFYVNAAVTYVRPLVALDLPKGALAGWPVLIDALREAREMTGYHMIFDGLIEQIGAQTKPPKPEVFSHLVVDKADSLKESVCGKVWRPSADVTVVGKCPDCVRIASDEEWIA